jgi:hypothetical protein
VCGLRFIVRVVCKWLELAGAPVCPIEGHGAMRHDPIDRFVEGLRLHAFAPSDEEQIVTKRLIHFTTKRLSGINRLAA